MMVRCHTCVAAAATALFVCTVNLKLLSRDTSASASAGTCTEDNGGDSEEEKDEELLRKYYWDDGEDAHADSGSAAGADADTDAEQGDLDEDEDNEGGEAVTDGRSRGGSTRPQGVAPTVERKHLIDQYPGCPSPKTDPLTREIVQLRKRVQGITTVMSGACEHAATAMARVPATRRGAAADQSTSLRTAEAALRELLTKEAKVLHKDKQYWEWQAFVGWLQGLTRTAEVYEISMLAAVVKEALFWRFVKVGTYAKHPLRAPVLFSDAVHRWVEAGKADEARRLHRDAVAAPLLGKAGTAWGELFEVPANHAYHFFNLRELRALPVPVPLKSITTLPPKVVQASAWAHATAKEPLCTALLCVRFQRC